MDEQPTTSARRDELLERSYRYVLATGLSDLSLRPLAAASVPALACCCSCLGPRTA